jgi:hypothetical protein
MAWMDLEVERTYDFPFFFIVQYLKDTFSMAGSRIVSRLMQGRLH